MGEMKRCEAGGMGPGSSPLAFEAAAAAVVPSSLAPR